RVRGRCNLCVSPARSASRHHSPGIPRCNAFMLTAQIAGRSFSPHAFSSQFDARWVAMQHKPFFLVGLLAVSPAFGQALPDGPAKQTIATACVACHALTRVTGAGHSRADWDTVVHMMVNAGAKVSADQVPVVVDYLAKNFPPKALPSAAILAGDINV